MTKHLDPQKIVKGSEKLVEIFGCWPSFHDAEVVSIRLDRYGKDKWEGVILHVSIHLFEGYRDEKAPQGINYRKHTVVNFRFGTVLDLEVVNFNQQNAIFDLTFEEGVPQSQDITWKGPAYQVSFEQSFGVRCSFVCATIEISSVEKTCPPGSVYDINNKFMKPEFTKNGYCNCHLPEEWKVNDKIPISYSEELNEYNLVCKGGHELMMYYCYFCGGKLPDSLRGQLFCELDQSEKDEVKSLIAKIDSVERIYEVLGEPDEIVESSDLKEENFFVLRSKSKNKCMRWYMYYKRWQSLNLQIYENQDGTLGFCIGQKYIGR